MRIQPTVYLSTQGILDISTDGLVFDFIASDYVSGSTTWNAAFGNYTASVSGTGSTLDYLSSSVGFNGNQWLTFNSEMDTAISSSAWEVYAYVTLANTSSNAYRPTLWSNGNGYAPNNWSYGYQGGTGSFSGFGNVDGGYEQSVNPTGTTTDKLNSIFSASFVPNQLIAMSYTSASTFTPSNTPIGYPYVTVNYLNTVAGNTLIQDYTNVAPINFSGSAGTELAFGKATLLQSPYDGINFSGSVTRLFAYNKVLTAQERKNNWFALTGIYIR